MSEYSINLSIYIYKYIHIYIYAYYLLDKSLCSLRSHRFLFRWGGRYPPTPPFRSAEGRPLAAGPFFRSENIQTSSYAYVGLGLYTSIYFTAASSGPSWRGGEEQSDMSICVHSFNRRDDREWYVTCIIQFR
jgi:hypothetical protein